MPLGKEPTVEGNLWERVIQVHGAPALRRRALAAEADLAEALSEIDRHHADFQKIRDVLNGYAARQSMDPVVNESFRAIRRVVG